MSSVTTESPAQDALEFTRPEWAFAASVMLATCGVGDVDADLVLLARETLRLWELAEVKYELLRSEKGYDVHDHLSSRIDKLYMALNAEARGDEVDFDGDPVAKWNRLVGLSATALAIALANGRWAALEHRQANDMRDALLNGVDVGPLGKCPELRNTPSTARAWNGYVGHEVVFTYHHGEQDRGIVTSANDKYVFVRFDGEGSSVSCEPERLRLIEKGEGHGQGE